MSNREINVNKVFAKLGSTGFFHVFGTTAINKIISFASGIILVRFISKSEYGIFSYANNLLGFFMIACGLGAASGVLQMCSEQREEQEKKMIYSYASRNSFFANIVLSIIIFLVSIFVPLKIEGANLCLGMMAFLPVASYIYEMQGFYLRTELRNKEYAISNAFSTVMIFILSCTMSYMFQIKGLVLGKYIAFALSAIFILLRYHITYPITVKVELVENVKKQFWNISLISMMNNGLSSLMYLLDIFVLGMAIPDSTVVASYKVATQIPTAMLFIPSAFITYIYPYFARHRTDKDWVRKKYLLASLAIAVVCFTISLICIIFAPIIIEIIFGEQYLDAVTCFRILSLSFAISSVFRVLPGNILVTQRKLKFNLFIAVVSSAFNTIMNVLFIAKWHSVGAALATILTVVLTSIINVSYLIYVLRKKHKT